jgi:hypothetical protein
MAMHMAMNNQIQTKQTIKLTREDRALQLFSAGAASKVRDDMYNVKSLPRPII